MLYHYVDSEGNKTTASEKPTLEEMQKWVGGYIERTTVLYNKKSCDVWLNSDGFKIFRFKRMHNRFNCKRKSQKRFIRFYSRQ